MASTLAKRLALETQPLGKGAIGAIAGAVVFLVLFFIAIGVFLWFYIRSATGSESPHVGPQAFDDYKSDLESGLNEKSLGPSTSSTLVPTTLPSRASALTSPPASHPKLVVDTPESTTPATAISTDDIIAAPPPTSSRKSRLQIDSGKAAPGYDWNRTSTVSSNSLEIPPTPGKDFV